jgi:hypothetical protein
MILAQRSAAAIHPAAMTRLKDEHHEAILVNLVQNAPVSRSDPQRQRVAD